MRIIKQRLVVLTLLVLVATVFTMLVGGCQAEEPLVLTLDEAEGVLAIPVVAGLSVNPNSLWQPSSLWSPVEPLLAVGTNRDHHSVVLLIDPINDTHRVLHDTSVPPALTPAWTKDDSYLSVVIPVYDDPQGWPVDYRIVQIDPLTGLQASSNTVSNIAGSSDMFKLRAFKWLDSRRLLLLDHKGTALDTLNVLDLSEGTLETVTELTLTFQSWDRNAAFMLWQAGGRRVGFVQLQPPFEPVWFDQSGVQVLNQISAHGVILTSWDNEMGRPNLVLWQPVTGLFSSVNGVFRMERESLRDGTGWGSVNQDGSMLACLEVQESDDTALLSLLLFKDNDRVEQIRVSLGDIPDEVLHTDWVDSAWFQGRRPIWSPVEDKVAFIDSTGGLWVLDVSDSSLLCLLSPMPIRDDLRDNVRLEWSPDGRFLAVVHSLASGETTLTVTRVCGQPL